MLKAFEIVKKTLDVHLIILGEGDERTEIETYIKNSNLANYVTLMGFVEEPSSYISACDLLCLSSISEGFGNVLIEALSVGTPVVSTNVGDIASYLPKECVIDEATPEALADACEHALQTDWESSPITLPRRTCSQTVGQQWSSLLEGLEEEE